MALPCFTDVVVLEYVTETGDFKADAGRVSPSLLAEVKCCIFRPTFTLLSLSRSFSGVLLFLATCFVSEEAKFSEKFDEMCDILSERRWDNS